MAKIIGITGGIASGKSVVTDFLRSQGYQVIDADQVVHELQKPEVNFIKFCCQNLEQKFYWQTVNWIEKS